MAPTSDSPIYQIAGLPIAGITTDQRGYTRPATPSLGTFDPGATASPTPVAPTTPATPPTANENAVATTVQLVSLTIVPNAANLTAQVTLTAQVNSTAGVVNEDSVTFTFAGQTIQGRVQNGIASGQS